MAVRMADTAEPMGDFPIAKAKHIEFEDGEKLQEKLDNGTLGSGGGTPYDDTEVRALIDTNKTDIADLGTKIGTTAMGTTATDVTGAVAEVNGNLLDTVSFSADYKNIVLNRKNGTNPYTIPISAIINNSKIVELGDVDVADIGNGKTLIYDAASQKHKYVDSTGTDELVKMDATADAHYLVDLIDKQTVVNDNGTLKVKMLDGQDVTITEINYLKGLTMNVMDLVNMFANGGVKVHNTPVATHADLTTLDRSTFIEGISYIVYVLADETHAGAKTTYLCDKTSSTYFGNADSQRNFTTDPIDLANEVTGKLPAKNIDVDSLWALLTVDDTYKTLTATDKVFGTHGAKAMYDELVTAIGAKANAADLTTHTDDTDIHVTTVEKDTWNNKANADEVVKKADIKTTLDQNSTNDDVYGGKAIFDAIKKNCVGKKTVLYEGKINATGTYTLTDDVNNYDLIVINHGGEGLSIQSLTITTTELKKNNQNYIFTCVHGNSDANFYMNGYFVDDKLIITGYNVENITSITGYKFGQVTVQNTIANPSPAASYSTDEQLTGGTWIDGKPIYRRVVTDIMVRLNPDHGWINIHAEPTVDTMVSITGYDKNSVLYGAVLYGINNGYLQGYSTGLASSVTKYVIEYTKTTD